MLTLSVKVPGASNIREIGSQQRAKGKLGLMFKAQTLAGPSFCEYITASLQAKCPIRLLSSTLSIRIRYLASEDDNTVDVSNIRCLTSCSNHASTLILDYNEQLFFLIITNIA